MKQLLKDVLRNVPLFILVCVFAPPFAILWLIVFLVSFEDKYRL